MISLNLIVSKARSIGLHVEAIALTPGDGNCFYHAVNQALSITDRPYRGDFNDLRQEIVSFVDTNRQSDCDLDYIDSFTIEERVSLDLDGLIRKHYTPGDYSN